MLPVMVMLYVPFLAADDPQRWLARALMEHEMAVAGLRVLIGRLDAQCLDVGDARRLLSRMEGRLVELHGFQRRLADPL
jgi:hypothetical protein